VADRGSGPRDSPSALALLGLAGNPADLVKRVSRDISERISPISEHVRASGGVPLRQRRASYELRAFWWFAAYVVSVVCAVLIPDRVDPLYTRVDPAADAAITLIATGMVTFALMVYFVRQRDRFQRRSDDLFHNILPEEIADRLKDSNAMIADSFGSASVLFADVVDFTPMSAGMTPGELVTLLDALFTTFDGFVRELGLEKIKTVGDAYMVASGGARPETGSCRGDRRAGPSDARPHGGGRGRPSPDPVADRDQLWPGRRRDHREPQVRVRSVGRHGQHREPHGVSGVPGAIQMTSAARELIEDRFVCEPRGIIPVKGKGEMEAYLLVSRRPDA